MKSASRNPRCCALAILVLPVSATAADVDAFLDFAQSQANTPVSQTRILGFASVDCAHTCPGEFCEDDTFGIRGIDYTLMVSASGTDAAEDGIGCAQDSGFQMFFSGAANLSTPGADESETHLSGSAGFGRNCGPGQPVVVCDVLGVWISSQQFFQYPAGQVASFNAYMTPLSAAYPGVSPGFRRRGTFVLHAGTGEVLGAAGSALAASGEAVEGFDANGNYSASFTLGQGAQELRTAVYDFHQSRLDVDNDGRFTAADRDALSTIIGNATRNIVSRFDVNNDGIIDQNDVGTLDWIMLNLLLADLDSGLFGDLDDDGDVDCDDLDLVPVHEGAVLGDANYLVQFDSDLDGISEDFEKGKLFYLVRPGDANWDQSVAFADITKVLENFFQTVDPYTRGDVNGSGTVDFFDTTLVLTHFGEFCP